MTTTQRPAPTGWKRWVPGVAVARQYRRSWLAGRKFDSTVLVEEAAASYYAHKHLKAAKLAARAFIAYPLRSGSFFSTLARRAWRAIG